MDKHGGTVSERLGGKGVTNMDEHGRTAYEGGVGGVTNMEERERTWTNLVEQWETLDKYAFFCPFPDLSSTYVGVMVVCGNSSHVSLS